MRGFLYSLARPSRMLVAAALVVVAGVQVIAPAAADAATTTGRVTRAGSQLVLDGQPWRFVGVNMFWLGLDESVTDALGPTYPSHAKIDEGFAAARTLGATVVRSTSLGVSVGTPRSLQPAPGRFNDAAFDAIDYSVATAARTGIRLMIPLTDMWRYYHGGKGTFADWRGRSEQSFYTDPAVIADFRAYIAHVLDHVNAYTGVRLGDDPTIAIWETGNELWDAPPTWTAQTATFIKSLAPRALVADGSAATGLHVSAAAIDAADVDIVGGHFYPTDLAWARNDARVAAQHGKAYVVGEFALNAAGGADAAGWMSALAADPNITGALAWGLMPHQADGTPAVSGDGYGFHVPGATPDEAKQVSVLQAAAPLFAPRVTAAPTPSAAPTPTPVPSATPTSSPVPAGPSNLVSAAVAAASSSTAFTGGTSGSGGIAVTTGSSTAGVTSLRATATASGYAWVYPTAASSGAPVVAGRTYTARVAARVASGSPVASAGHITWYDASGSWLGGTDGPSTTPTAGGWTALTATGTAPARAAWAVPQWQSAAPLAAGDAVELTALGMWEGTSAPAMTASTSTPAPTATPAPAPANLLGAAIAVASSPTSFTAGASSGTPGRLTRGPDLDGAATVRFTATSADYAWVYGRSFSDGAPVTPGTAYTASLVARPGAATSVPYSARISWYDASGTYLGGVDGSRVVPSGTSSTALTVTATAPARAAWAMPQWQTSATLSVGSLVDLTGFRMVKAAG